MGKSFLGKTAVFFRNIFFLLHIGIIFIQLSIQEYIKKWHILK
jgi:hypothetical protein